MCGKVMYRNTCHGEQPSILAASMTSSGLLCSPASRISIMNGVHSHTRETTIDVLGQSEIQSGCTAFGPKTIRSSPLNRP